MANNKIFETVPVKTPNRSTFDLSNSFKTTGKLSELIPCAAIETLPGDKFEIKANYQVRLAALKQPILDKINARVEWFFVPNTLVWNNWTKFITNNSTQAIIPGGGSQGVDVYETPYINLQAADTANGTLADYLGFGAQFTAVEGSTRKVNALPFLAYQQIYSDYYRNEQTSIPYPSNYFIATGSDYTGAKSYLNKVQNRCWSKDFITTMTTTPTGVNDAVALPVDNVIVDGSSTIDAATLSIGKLQLLRCGARWSYNQMIGGSRYQESILAHYGVLPSDTSMRRAQFLGSSKAVVDVSGVVNSTDSNGIGGMPLATMAGLGNAYSMQDGSFTFSCKDHGYIIGIFSVMPEATYLNGCARHLLKSAYVDYAFPEFEGVGEQTVYQGEINNNTSTDAGAKTKCGYQQRYYEYKQIPDTVHGGLKNLTGDIGAYTMVRNLVGGELTNAMVQPDANDTAFNRCFAPDTIAGGSAGNPVYHFVAGIDMDIKANRTLSEYSIPLF